MFKQEMIRGTFTAIATPFSADLSSVDYNSLGDLLEFQLSAGVNGVVACGSTGEASTLSDQEYRDVVKFVRERTSGKIPCVAGIGTNSTSRAVESAKLLKELKVDAALVVNPPYNKPSQDGLIAHFREIKKSVDLPLVAYNIPGRSAVNMLPQTVATLTRERLIIGLKESTGSLDQFLDIFSLVGNTLAVMSGEDTLVHALMASGATGVISASANVIPELFLRITNNAMASEWLKARDAQYQALPIIKALFFETNPVPVKAALELKGIIRCGKARLPLLPARPDTIAKLKELLAV